MPEELLFLGTGAADWSLNSEQQPLRRCSSVLLGAGLLIDPGPHIFHFEQSFGYQDLYKGVKSVLLTHSHDDHLSLDTLRRLAACGPVTLYADEAIKGLTEGILNLRFCPLPLREPVRVDGYEVTAVAANHSTEIIAETPRHFIIHTPAGRTMFYGCDGAWLLNRSWKEVKKHCFDLMVLDGTIGEVQGDSRIFEHNSLDMARLMCAAFRRTGMVKQDTVICVSHLARTLHGPHEKVAASLKQDGIMVAYDNLRLKI